MSKLKGFLKKLKSHKDDLDVDKAVRDYMREIERVAEHEENIRILNQKTTRLDQATQTTKQINWKKCCCCYFPC